MDEWILSIFVIYLIYPIKTYKILIKKFHLISFWFLKRKYVCFKHSRSIIVVLFFMLSFIIESSDRNRNSTSSISSSKWLNIKGIFSVFEKRHDTEFFNYEHNYSNLLKSLWGSKPLILNFKTSLGPKKISFFY